MNIIFFFLSLILQSMLSWGIDVSWLPSDPDGPLPVSTKYRDALRKLCKILHSGSKLPKELILKRRVLENMCKKMDIADTNVKSSSFNFPFRKNIFALLGIGGGSYLLWMHRETIHKVVVSIWRQSKSQKVLGKSTAEYADDIRKARLKRFLSSELEDKED